MDDKLYQIYTDWQFSLREQLFEKIAATAEANAISFSKAEIVELLQQRELIGDTQIAEHVVLPHLQSSVIQKSRVFFISLTNPISEWSATIKDVQLVIVILLKQEETAATIKPISRIMRKLADEDFIEELLELKNKEDWEQVLKIVENEE